VFAEREDIVMPGARKKTGINQCQIWLITWIRLSDNQLGSEVFDGGLFMDQRGQSSQKRPTTEAVCPDAAVLARHHLSTEQNPAVFTPAHINLTSSPLLHDSLQTHDLKNRRFWDRLYVAPTVRRCSHNSRAIRRYDHPCSCKLRIVS